MIWCDSVNNMNRTLDRQGMKEFENRILFQMSANDSSTLIDTPAGSKLGENRALYYSEEANRIEKFRPYGIPEIEWLESVKKRFESRPRPATNGQPGGAENGSATALEPTAPAGGARSDGNAGRTCLAGRSAGGLADRAGRATYARIDSPQVRAAFRPVGPGKGR